MVIVWSVSAKEDLKKLYQYILNDSYDKAVKVRQEILDSIFCLPENPNKYPVDKFKINNDGTWRAFELYHYRISYRVKENQIRVVRLRHTSSSPLPY